MTVNDRIRLLIKAMGHNPHSFAKEAGIHNPTLQHIIGARKTNPSYEVIYKIMVAFPEVDPTWLIIGKGKMIRTEGLESRLEKIEKKLKVKSNN